MQKGIFGFRSNTIKTTITATLAAASLTLGLGACSADTNSPELTAEPSSSDSATPESSASPEVNESTEPSEENASTESPSDGNFDAAKQTQLLEKYADLERASFDTVREMYPDLYSDMTAETQGPGAISFQFTYAELMDIPATQASFESQLTQMTEQIDRDVFPLMRDFGLQGDLTITYQYFAPDKSLIWEHIFESTE